MNHEALALEWISKYLGQSIDINDVGYEANVFDYDELDEILMPEKHVSLFKQYKHIQTHVYVYDTIMVYILLPLEQADAHFILIGLMDNDILIRYRLRKEVK